MDSYFRVRESLSFTTGHVSSACVDDVDAFISQITRDFEETFGPPNNTYFRGDIERAKSVFEDNAFYVKCCDKCRGNSQVASTLGHLECLQRAHERHHGGPFDLHVITNAAYGGHLPCLKYAHEHGAPLNFHVAVPAANNGHLECLKYCHENGVPWDAMITYAAANSGNLECLRYAIENGSPWTLTMLFNLQLKGDEGNVMFKYCVIMGAQRYACLKALMMKARLIEVSSELRKRRRGRFALTTSLVLSRLISNVDDRYTVLRCIVCNT